MKKKSMMSNTSVGGKTTAAAAVMTKTGKRKITAPDRYGNTIAENMDSFFGLNTEESTDSDVSLEVQSVQSESSNVTNSSKDVSQGGNFGTEPCVQMARIEAKLDGIINEIHKIQRTIISLTMNSTNPTNIDVNNVNYDFLRMFPIMTVESMDKFERDLNVDAFRRMVVEYFCTINGINGAKEGGKIMRSVVYGMICPSVLTEFTWTGNSNHNQPGQKKNFNQKRNIFDIFFTVIKAYDKKYTKMNCEDDLKKKIFKHVKKQATKVGQSNPNRTQATIDLLSVPIISSEADQLMPKKDELQTVLIHSQPPSQSQQQKQQQQNYQYVHSYAPLKAPMIHPQTQYYYIND